MVMGFVFGFAGGDGVSESDFSPSSRLWLQTKWVVVGLGLPAWGWGLWAVAADRLPWVWLGCEKKYIKKELFYNVLM